MFPPIITEPLTDPPTGWRLAMWLLFIALMAPVMVWPVTQVVLGDSLKGWWTQHIGSISVVIMTGSLVMPVGSQLPVGWRLTALLLLPLVMALALFCLGLTAKAAPSPDALMSAYCIFATVGFVGTFALVEADVLTSTAMAGMSTWGALALTWSRKLPSPNNVVPPTIVAQSEKISVGTNLMARPGEWSWGRVKISYEYSWKRKTSSGESIVPDAREAIYTVGDADQGASVAVTVTASTPLGGKSSATSSPVLIEP